MKIKINDPDGLLHAQLQELLGTGKSLHGLVRDLMHEINTNAQSRGYINGVAWAKEAADAGEIRGTEKNMLYTFHGSRNDDSHGHAEEDDLDEDDILFLLSIRSKIEQSQLRADGDSWEEHATERATPEEIEAWFQEGKEYYDQMQYEEAVKYYRKAAAQGHRGAQNNLAVCYANGQGVPKDDGKAVQWFRKSAEQGHPVAQENLGAWYLYGRGVEKDWSKAVSLFQKAAEQGNAWSQYYLAECYFWGKGIKKDDKEAFWWYEKAAEQGNASAMGRLGDCYYDGIGVAQNYEKAFSWYQKGAEKKDGTAQNGLGNCYYYSHGVKKNSGTAEDYYEKAANQGDPFAQLQLAHIKQAYYDSNNQYKWYKEEADKWNAGAKRAFEARLQNGSAEEYYAYACYLYYARHDDCCDPHACYRWGERNERNWIAKAAEMGHVNALTIVGAELVKPQSFDMSRTDYWQAYKNDEQKGRKMLLAAAKQGSAEAMSHLGVNYIESPNLETSQVEGGKWLLKAEARGYLIPAKQASYLKKFLEGGHMTPDMAEELRKLSEQGYSKASRYLSLCYENGYGVEKNEQEQLRYLQLSADQGDGYAAATVLTAGEKKEKGKRKTKEEKAAEAAQKMELLLEAAERGDVEAQYKAGCAYAKGKGVKKNAEEAFKWYKKAADGHWDTAARDHETAPIREAVHMASYEVALCYENGKGVEKDYKKAIGYYFYAQNADLPDEAKAEVNYKVGHAYVTGDLGIRKPYSAAKYHLEIAAKLGHQQAKKELPGVRLKSMFEK